MIRRRATTDPARLPDLARLPELDRLAELDPAGPADPGAAQSVVARAMLDRVVATPREVPGAVGGSRGAATGAPDARRSPVRSPGRLALAGAAVAALAVAAAVLPGLGDPRADAAWTAVPGQLDHGETSRATEDCRDAWRATETPEHPSEAQLAAMRPVVAEHRGGTSLIVVADGPWVASCLLDDAGYVAAFSGPSAVAPVLDAGDVTAWSAFMSRAPDGGALLAVVGRAGPDVVAASLRPQRAPEGVDVVDATVANGWFIAFWPVTEDGAGLDPTTTPTTVTLRTGEVLRDVDLAWPGP